jgi:hypothetical protein
MGKFQEQLDDSVGDHPVVQFQNMAALDDQDNFAEEFAKLINTLAMNIVIPAGAIETSAGESKQEAIKKWLAKHSDGNDSVYTEMGGEMKVAKPTVSPGNTPQGPEDIKIESMAGGMYRPTKEYTRDKDYNVDDIDSEVEVTLVSE